MRTDQNVEVFGHDHIAHNLKPILPSYLLEYAEENIARTPTSQKRLPFVATAGDENEGHDDRKYASDAWARRAIINVPPSSQPTLANHTREWGTRVLDICAVYQNGNGWGTRLSPISTAVFPQTL